LNCPACGHENRADARFCGECAAPIAQEQACRACGRSNPVGQRFCDRCAQPLNGEITVQPERDPRSYTPKHLADKILTSRSALEGERKQVTVLFVDVGSSMELSERIDPEDWHRILDRFFGILADGVHRFEGTVNQYTGDGIMALFGAPIAHEDHAQRACYAALHLRDELRRYADELRRTRAQNLSVRMGLHSGEVVVGRIGDDLRMDYTAQGHTVGLAARVERLADPWSTYLTEPTARLVHGFFTLRDLGDFELKGATDPVRVHELQGVGPLRTRLEVARSRGFSRFVGREPEFAALQLALDRSAEGHGQVVGVVGEAGLGKSRLCLEVAESCRASGFSVLEAHCPPHGESIPFLPILELFRSRFGITERDGDDEARQKIASTLVLMHESFEESLPLVFEFLGVDYSDRPAPRIDPEARQRQLFAFVRRLIQSRSERELTVILVDDLHWVDSGSEAFIGQIVEAVGGTRTMLLLNFRSDYHADWMAKSYYQQIPLVPLGPEATEQMLYELLGAEAAAAGLPRLVRERTGGNPFFIEEVIRSLVESGSLEGDRGAYRLAKPVEDLEIPPTVQAVLAARIDRLADREKQVLHRAAVIGKQFAELVLRRVAELPDSELAASLAALCEAEFIYEESLYPETEYAFKNPQTQEVAYDSQLRERRARIHSAVARTIENLYPEKLDERAALLSHHWEAAGERVEAARWNQRAAPWAGRSDRAEELRHWEKVQSLLETEDESNEGRALSLRACANILRLGVRQGLSSERASAAFHSGRALAEAVADLRSLAVLHADYGEFLARSDADLKASVQLSREAVKLAERSQDRELLLQVTASLAMALWSSGRYREGYELTSRIIATQPDELGLPFRRLSMASAILAAWLGRPAEAMRRLEHVLALAPEKEELYFHTETQYWAALCSGFLGDAEAAMRHARQTLVAAEKDGTNQSLSVAHHALGEAHALFGDWDDASRCFQRRLDLDSSRYDQPAILADLAEALAHQGDRVRAREALDRSLALIRDRAGQPRCGVFLTCARAVLQMEGADGHAEIASLLSELARCIDATEARVYQPTVHAVRGVLARLLGDRTGCERELREAGRLFAEMGAREHAERVARELVALGS
jgi:class 3 adenylate cyclase/tetratricopeptide (TPR) repeat protein